MSVKLAENGAAAATALQQTKSGPVIETSADAFDKDDFDPLRYINEMFPSGEHASCMGSSNNLHKRETACSHILQMC